jgi:hypothetical protein
MGSLTEFTEENRKNLLSGACLWAEIRILGAEGHCFRVFPVRNDRIVILNFPVFLLKKEIINAF